jgi:hypothetical protein
VRARPQQNAIRIIEEEKMTVQGTPTQQEEVQMASDWEGLDPEPSPMNFMDFAAPFDLDQEKQNFPEFLSFDATYF